MLLLISSAQNHQSTCTAAAALCPYSLKGKHWHHSSFSEAVKLSFLIARATVFLQQILPNSAAQFVKFRGANIPNTLHSVASWHCCIN